MHLILLAVSAEPQYRTKKHDKKFCSQTLRIPGKLKVQETPSDRTSPPESTLLMTFYHSWIIDLFLNFDRIELSTYQFLNTCLFRCCPCHSPDKRQVWPLTQFFSVSFLWKLIDLPGGFASMTPHRGNTILFRSSQQLPRLRLGPSKGFFELTRCPWRALDSPCALLLELQRYKDTDTGVPR